MNIDFSTLTTAADKASAYNSMLSSGMSDAQIRQAATSALGAQTNADWTALQGLATSARPAASQATQPTGLLATQQPLTIPQSVYQGTPQSKAVYYNQQLSAGYSDAQIRQAAGPQTDTDWTALQGLAGKPPSTSTTTKPASGLSASPFDASVVNSAWQKQLNDSAYFIQKFGDEGRQFAVETFNWEVPFKQAGLDDATIKAIKGIPGLTNSINWGAVASSADQKDALLAATRQYAQQKYGGVEFRFFGNDNFGVPTYGMYGKNGEQLSLVQGGFAEAFNRANVLGGDPSQLVDVSAGGTPGDSTSGFLKGMSGDTFSQWREDLKSAANGATPYSVTGNYGNLLYQQRPGSGTYDAWAASGFDPKNPIYGDPSYGGANGIDTGQGLLADPNNKSAEALAYRKNAAVYGNTPAYQGAGGTTGGATQWSSSGSGAGAGAGSASNISGPNVTRAVNGVEETIEGRVGNLLKTDTQGNYTNQVVRQAADRAMQQMAGRGLLNSSMAMQAAQEAAIAKAIEIAGPDAQTYFQQGRANQDAQNVFARDDKAYQYDLGKMAYQSQLDLSKLSEQQRFELQKLALTHSYDSTSKDKDYAFTASEAEKDRQARLKEANISVEANKDQSWRFELARLEQQASMGNANAQVVSNAYGNLMENELRISTMDIGEDAKLRLLQQQATTFNNLAEANGSTLRAPTYTKAAAADAQNNVGGAGMLSTASDYMP